MTRSAHKSNGHGHGHGTETPDVSHIKNIDVTHEESDVNVPALLKFVIALTVMTVVVYVLMLALFTFFNRQITRNDPEPGPMALSEQERLPPEPRLQGGPGFGVNLEDGKWVPLENREPEAEYEVLRQQWENVLKEGSKDSSGRTTGAPIKEAMKMVVEQGLPSRQAESRTFKEFGISVPTASSSGRVTKKVN